MSHLELHRRKKFSAALYSLQVDDPDRRAKGRAELEQAAHAHPVCAFSVVVLPAFETIRSRAIRLWTVEQSCHSCDSQRLVFCLYVFVRFSDFLNQKFSCVSDNDETAAQ